MLEHPEIGWIERTGYPSWLQEVEKPTGYPGWLQEKEDEDE